MDLVDTHCHLDRVMAVADLDAALAAARAAGVVATLVPSVDEASWEGVAALAERYPGVFPAFGVHPQHAADVGDRLLARLETALTGCRAVAVGEVGLDRTVPLPRALQERALAAQLEVAAGLRLPVLLHIRDLWQAALRLLDAQPGLVGGVAHAFGGSHETALALARRGVLIGVGGVATRPTATRLRRVVARLPRDLLVVETDAPYQPPVGCAGPCLPVHLRDILGHVAALRGEPPSLLAEATTARARALLGRLAT